MNMTEVSAKLDRILAGDATALVDYAEFLGKTHAPQDKGEKDTKLSSSQIRHVLDDLQRMGKFNRNQLQLLRPKLAYAAGKAKMGSSFKDLQKILDLAIDKTDTEEKFPHFKNFFEAIVGYHRYHSKVREG